MTHYKSIKTYNMFSYTDINDELPVNSVKGMGISDNLFSV